MLVTFSQLAVGFGEKIVYEKTHRKVVDLVVQKPQTETFFGVLNRRILVWVELAALSNGLGAQVFRTDARKRSSL